MSNPRRKQRKQDKEKTGYKKKISRSLLCEQPVDNTLFWSLHSYCAKFNRPPIVVFHPNCLALCFSFFVFFFLFSLYLSIFFEHVPSINQNGNFFTGFFFFCSELLNWEILGSGNEKKKVTTDKLGLCLENVVHVMINNRL